MPTQALRERGDLLLRALDSVTSQEGVNVVPLLVINGPHRDPEVTRQLVADSRLRVTTRDDADLPAALRAGRELVDTAWFAELDDDDVLLPRALALRVQMLKGRPDLDAVVSNGIRRFPSGDTESMPDPDALERDPVRALLGGTWLLPGSWLCRSETVGPRLFDGMPKYLECTYLALRFALDFKVAFLRRPTLIWHADTPLSESKSRDYVLGQAAALLKLLELDLPPDVRAAFERRMANVRHTIADLHLREGSVKEAWRWHLHSLREPGGWRYLPFTRRVLPALWTR